MMTTAMGLIRQFKPETLTQTQMEITFEFSLLTFERLIYVALKRKDRQFNVVLQVARLALELTFGA